jgi:FkbM family methyltransferase
MILHSKVARYLEDDQLASTFFVLCSSLDVSTFIDIGSNRPENGKLFLGNSKKSNALIKKGYFAFEANPWCFSYYYEEFAQDCIFANIAITNRNGFERLCLPNNAEASPHGNIFIRLMKHVDTLLFPKYHLAVSRFHMANNLGASSSQNSNCETGFDVVSLRLDSLWRDFDTTTVLWIDVEGALIEVLEGAGELLRSPKLVALFVESEQPVSGQETWKTLESHKILEVFGFRLVAFSNLNNAIYLRDTVTDVRLDSDSIIGRRSKDKSSVRRTYYLRLKSIFSSVDQDLRSWRA